MQHGRLTQMRKDERRAFKWGCAKTPRATSATGEEGSSRFPEREETFERPWKLGAKSRSKGIPETGSIDAMGAVTRTRACRPFRQRRLCRCGKAPRKGNETNELRRRSDSAAHAISIGKRRTGLRRYHEFPVSYRKNDAPSPLILAGAPAQLQLTTAGLQPWLLFP